MTDVAHKNDFGRISQNDPSGFFDFKFIRGLLLFYESKLSSVH